MTGPEHYREAEKLLISMIGPDPVGPKTIDFHQASVMIARAHVHATLALAAATALPHLHDTTAWQEVAQ